MDSYVTLTIFTKCHSNWGYFLFFYTGTQGMNPLILGVLENFEVV